MVNDQLIRIHHMRLLSYDKMMTKQLEERRAAAAAAAAALAPDVAPPHLQGSASVPSSPTQTKSLSSSAPETGLLLDQCHSSKQQQERPCEREQTQQADGPAMGPADDSASLGDTRHKQREAHESLLSRSQSFLPVMKNYGAGGKKFREENLEHSYNGAGGGRELVSGQADKSQPFQAASNKKKSSWRHLLSPSYKSRSDEFHKFFADEVPADERLIADYSCALHREILIQGRVYISINYIAFYSNLFSWITKLVVRLRDIADIYKANTARIIPNAIQIVTNSGDKHVFASFIARDKSYIMFWRIWRNNLLMERMSDEELRSLVHLSYGKDLGMSTDEELKINSPEPKTPANVEEAPADQQQQQQQQHHESPPDGNNNNNSNSSAHDTTGPSSEACPLESSVESGPKPVACDTASGECELAPDKSEGARSRYNSVDYNNSQAQPLDSQQARVLSELSQRLRDISTPDTPAPTSTGSAANSPWVELGGGSPPAVDSDGAQQVGLEEGDNMQARAAHFKNLFGRKSTAETAANTTTCTSEHSGTLPSDGVAAQTDGRGRLAEEAPVVGDEQQAGCLEKTKEEEEGEGAEAHTACDCESHEGMLVADEQFDIGVDTLFSLIFTNSRFMRAYMLQRGMTDAIVSRWRRATNAADNSNSNSSTLSRSLDEGASAANGRSRRNSVDSNVCLARRPSVRSRQQRQLNYSMNINHVLAKQIQVEEKQNICSARPGVYVLKSQSVNSGVPFSESFTVDLTYCMTRAGGRNQSRMRVHGGVNFIKERHSWKLAMVKSVIEKQSVQGINEFVADLIERIREYVARKRQQLAVAGAPELDLDQVSLLHQDRELYHEPAEAAARHQRAQSGVKSGASMAARSSGSLARAKSKQKERKLRNMYKYYMEACAGPASHSDEQAGQFEGRGAGAADSDDSFGSSLDAGLDDNDSMVMMMATHETDAASQLAHSERFGGRAQSFSDLEWGQSMDEEAGAEEEDEDEERRSSSSEASNVTINNGNMLAANYLQRAAVDRRKQAGDKRRASTEGARRARARLGQAHSAAGAPQRPARGQPLAAGSRGQPLVGQRARSSCQKSSLGSSSPLEGLWWRKELASLAVALLALLLCALLALHLVVLQRLASIEARLAAANCADRWPAANQSVAASQPGA